MRLPSTAYRFKLLDSQSWGQSTATEIDWCRPTSLDPQKITASSSPPYLPSYFIRESTTGTALAEDLLLNLLHLPIVSIIQQQYQAAIADCDDHSPCNL